MHVTDDSLVNVWINCECLSEVRICANTKDWINFEGWKDFLTTKMRLRYATIKVQGVGMFSLIRENIVLSEEQNMPVRGTEGLVLSFIFSLINTVTHLISKFSSHKARCKCLFSSHEAICKLFVK